MTAAQQHRAFGASAEAVDGQVIFQVGKEMIAMTPAEARKFIYYVARAYTRADITDSIGRGQRDGARHAQ